MRFWSFSIWKWCRILKLSDSHGSKRSIMSEQARLIPDSRAIRPIWNSYIVLARKYEIGYNDHVLRADEDHHVFKSVRLSAAMTSSSHCASIFTHVCCAWGIITIIVIFIAMGSMPVGVRRVLHHLLPLVSIQCCQCRVAHFLQTCSAPPHDIVYYPIFEWASFVCLQNVCLFSIKIDHSEFKDSYFVNDEQTEIVTWPPKTGSSLPLSPKAYDTGRYRRNSNRQIWGLYTVVHIFIKIMLTDFHNFCTVGKKIFNKTHVIFPTSP